MRRLERDSGGSERGVEQVAPRGQRVHVNLRAHRLDLLGGGLQGV